MQVKENIFNRGHNLYDVQDVKTSVSEQSEFAYGLKNDNATVFFDNDLQNERERESIPEAEAEAMEEQLKVRMWIFVLLLGFSGLFSSTFTLTFAYISDTIKNQGNRVNAFGLALATFGLSFTIGPVMGGYLALVEKGGENITQVTSNEKYEEHVQFVHPLGQKRVLFVSMVIVMLDLLYILFILPESVSSLETDIVVDPLVSSQNSRNKSVNRKGSEISKKRSTRSALNRIRKEVLPNIQTFSPLDSFRVFWYDTILFQIGTIAFLYYTALWAIVSTLMLYATKRFGFGPEQIGFLMSAKGFSTMVSEAVLVRLIIPAIGEKRSLRLGLLAFMTQCITLGLAYEGWQLFIPVVLSMIGNLVYPSLTSMVTSSVNPEMVGEALGAINGLRALTEGVGPLVFGTLMSISEGSRIPGWPYLLAALSVAVAYKKSASLPDEISNMKSF